MAESDERSSAKKRLEAKSGFFVHLAVYVAVMVSLVIINLITSPGEVWFVWPLIGWGFAVVLLGVRVFYLAGKNAIVEAMTIALSTIDQNQHRWPIPRRLSNSHAN